MLLDKKPYHIGPGSGDVSTETVIIPDGDG